MGGFDWLLGQEGTVRDSTGSPSDRGRFTQRREHAKLKLRRTVRSTPAIRARLRLVSVRNRRNVGR